MRTRKFHALLTAITGVTIGSSVHAATYTWVPTATGTTYDWTTQSNWSGGTLPIVAGDVVNMDVDIAGAQTSRLQSNTTLGTLNFGDANGSHAFTISSGAGGTGANVLTFEAPSGGNTYLNIGGAGTVTNVITAGIALGGTSPLTASFAGTQRLNLRGGVSVNGNTLTFSGTGGTLGIGTGSADPGITGIGAIVKNTTAQMDINSASNSFTGSLTLNAGTTLMVSGQIRDVSNLTINGRWTAGGLTQYGAQLTVGSGSAYAAASNRLPSGTITLNGGYLNNLGQNLSAVGGTVSDSIANLNFGSGYSIVTHARGNDDNNYLTAATLGRGSGATGAIRSGTLGASAKITVTDGAASHLKGGGGAAGSTNMSIIPWLMVSNTNQYAQNPSGWGTYVSGIGIRALQASEYSTTLTGTSDRNVQIGGVGSLGNGAAQTINSLQLTAGGASNIGNGSVLTVSSGALLFALDGQGLGVPGSANAGTVAFGAAEAVIWAHANDSVAFTDTIGAVITGTGGLTKAGLGTLVLAGANNYTGKTTVSAGTLQVGNGTQTSILAAAGDVEVANGATLSLLNSDAIADGATVTLDSYGLFNGKMNLAAGVTDTVAALYFGSTAQASGTYGSTSSAATYKSDVYFSGTGILSVVAIPEPATIALLSISGLALLRRRS